MKIKISEVTAEFHRCHQSVIEHLGGADEIAKELRSGNGGHMRIMRDAWQDLHGIKIRTGQGFGDWQTLEFEDEQACMIWLLRWS